MAITKALYPKTYEILSKWIVDKLATGVHNTPQITNALPSGVMTEFVLKSNGRILYTFFDEYQLYPQISKYGNGWKWRVETTVPMEGFSETRELGEERLFEECAKRLENIK